MHREQSLTMVQKDKTLEPPPVDAEQSPSPVSGEACAEAPGPVEQSGIAVEPIGHRKFISGVVEGNDDIRNRVKTFKCDVRPAFMCMQSKVGHQNGTFLIIDDNVNCYQCEIQVIRRVCNWRAI